MSALKMRMGRWAPTRQGTLLSIALLYGFWMGFWAGLSYLFLFLLFYVAALFEVGIGAALGGAAYWLAPPPAVYAAVHLERVAAAGRRLRYGLGSRWFKSCALALLAAALAAALALPFLGFTAAVVTATASGLLLLISAVTPRNAGWAFAVLTIFVLSIGAFNALTLTFSGLTLPAHAAAFAVFLWLQRNVLRTDPARLARLARLGIALCAVLAAVHGAVLWAELAGLDPGGQLSSIGLGAQITGDKGGVALYLGYPLPFTVLLAGVLLLLLPDRVPRAASAPVIALGLAGIIAWPLLAPMLLSVSGLEWATFPIIGRGAWIAD